MVKKKDPLLRNHKWLVDEFWRQTPFTREECKLIVAVLFGIIFEEVVRGYKVKIEKIGVFTPHIGRSHFGGGRRTLRCRISQFWKDACAETEPTASAEASESDE